MKCTQSQIKTNFEFKIKKINAAIIREESETKIVK